MTNRNRTAVYAFLSLFFSFAASFLSAAPANPSWVSVSNYRILVTYRLPDNTLSAQRIYSMQGVGWSPYSIGNSGPPAPADWSTWYGTDIPLMGQMYCNTIRTWQSFPLNATGTNILNACYDNGIMVIMTVDVSNAYYTPVVNAFRKHPAILMWLVGNEWNANLFYGKYGSIAACISAVNSACAGIKAIDTRHPVATCYGELPDASVLASCTGPDVWGLNIYPGVSFGSRFASWKNLSSKPMFISEFGNDAFNSNASSQDQTDQVIVEKRQWADITNHMVLLNPADRVCSGGCIFEFNDEWWKNTHGSSIIHDSGPYEGTVDIPDNVFDEEWWGIVDIARTPRMAYYALKSNWFCLSLANPRINLIPGPLTGTNLLTINIACVSNMTSYTLRCISPAGKTNLLPLTPTGSGTYDLAAATRFSNQNPSGTYRLIFRAKAGGKWKTNTSAFRVDTEGPVAPLLKGVWADDDGLTVEWGASSDNMSGVKSYAVYRSADGIAYTALGTTASLSWEDGSAAEGILYYYRVCAVDNLGNYGPMSAVLTGKITSDSLTVFPVPVDFQKGILKFGLNIGRDSTVSLDVMDQAGYVIRSFLKNSQVQKGWHLIEWDGRDEHDRKTPHGLYFCKMSVKGGKTTVKKILVTD